MTDQLISVAVSRARRRDIGVPFVQYIVTGTGAAVSVCFLGLWVLEAAGLAHSDVGGYLMWLYRYGETLMPAASGEFFHGEWGDRMFVVIALPTLAGLYLSAGLEWLRSR